MSGVNLEHNVYHTATLVENIDTRPSAFSLALSSRLVQDTTEREQQDQIKEFHNRTLNRVRSYTKPKAESEPPTTSKVVSRPVPQISNPVLQQRKPVTRTTPSPVVIEQVSPVPSSSSPIPSIPEKQFPSPRTMHRKAQERYQKAIQSKNEPFHATLCEIKQNIDCNYICSCPGSFPFDLSTNSCADNCPMKNSEVKRKAVEVLENYCLEEAKKSFT
ncbi:hypothetical protein RCL1_006437 [Eukaryota sp. TZLM3-RCL]